MIRKILCAIPLITILSLAPSVIMAAETDSFEANAVFAQSNMAAAAELPVPEMESAAQTEAAEPQMTGPAGMTETDIAAESAESAEQEAETAAEEAISQPSYTEEELYIMAHLLAGESQNCPDEEQLYVGSVVLNRVAHPSFPGTIKGVVFQKGQYSCTRDGNYYREPTERNWANARTLLESGSVLPGNVIWQSGGKQGKGVYLKTRWHYYCY